MSGGLANEHRIAVNDLITLVTVLQTAVAKITDVARVAGVSATTVSHALSGRGWVDARTRARVIEVARELDRPNLRAQRLRTGAAQTIALVSSMPFAIAGGPSRLGFFGGGRRFGGDGVAARVCRGAGAAA